MKRKMVFPVLAAIVLVSLISCASSSKGFKNAQALLPVGIVAVTAPDRITWYGEGEDLDRGLVDIFFEDKEAIPSQLLVSSAEQILFESLKSGNVPIVERNAMLDSASYTAAELSKVMNLTPIVYPENYKYFVPHDTDIIQSLALETGMNSAAFIHFGFYTAMRTGIGKSGTMSGFVTMEVIFMSPEGKLITNRTYTAKTDETISVVFGGYDTQKLLKLYPSALTAVCTKFASDFIQ